MVTFADNSNNYVFQLSSHVLTMASFSTRLASPATKVAAAVLAGSGTAAFLYGRNKAQSARCWSSNAHLKYPASSNYPDLAGHNNIMAEVLTPGVCIMRCCNMNYVINLRETCG